MPHSSLMNLIESIRKKYRQFILLSGISNLIVIIILMTMFFGFIDWSFRLDNQWVRALFLLVLVFGLTWYLVKNAFLPFYRGLSYLSAARVLEVQRPELKDQVQSAVMFLAGNNQGLHHSVSLRNHFIRDVEGQFEGSSWKSFISSQFVYTRMLVLGLIILLAGILSVQFQDESRLALQRLFTPFASAQWPNRIQLEILDSSFNPIDPGNSRISFYQDEKNILYVRNSRGELPNEVLLHYQEVNRDVQTDILRKVQLNTGDQTEELAVISLPYIDNDAKIRVTGGDDQNENWYQVSKISPPQIKGVSVQIKPPGYTGEKTETSERLSGKWNVLLNTEIHIQGSLSKPVRNGVFLLGKKELKPEWINSEGRNFELKFKIEQPGLQKFSLNTVDENSAVFRIPMYEFNAIADQAPQVKIEEPEGKRTVTPEAKLAILLKASDDYGLADVILNYESGQKLKGNLQIKKFEDQATKNYEASFDWDLEFLDLLPGMTVHYDLAVHDYYPGNRQTHKGKSFKNELSIISKEEKLQEVKDKLQELTKDLYDLIQLEKIASSEIRELALQFENTGHLRKDDYRLFRNSQLHQNQFSERLTSPVGFTAKIQLSLQEFRNNQLEEPVLQENLVEWVSLLSGIEKNEFLKIDQSIKELTRYEKKLFEENNSDELPRNEISGNFKTISSLQDQVIVALESIHIKFEVLENARKFLEAIEMISVEQKELYEETVRMSKVTLTRSEINLTSQEKTDLARLAMNQSDLRTRYQKELEATVSLSMQDGNSTSSNAVVTYLQEKNLVNLFNEASQLISDNKVGQAVESQKKIIEILVSALNLSKPGENDPQSRNTRRALSESEKAIASIYNRQDELNKSLQKMIRESSEKQKILPGKEFIDKQNQLKEEVSHELQMLENQDMEISLEFLKKVSQFMESAAVALSQDELKDADEFQKAALVNLKQFQKDLKQSTESLDQKINQNAFEEAFKKLGEIYKVQLKIAEESRRIYKDYLESERFTRATIREIVQLGETQAFLMKEVELMAGNSRFPDSGFHLQPTETI